MAVIGSLKDCHTAAQPISGQGPMAALPKVIDRPLGIPELKNSPTPHLKYSVSRLVLTQPTESHAYLHIGR